MSRMKHEMADSEDENDVGNNEKQGTQDSNNNNNNNNNSDNNENENGETKSMSSRKRLRQNLSISDNDSKQELNQFQLQSRLTNKFRKNGSKESDGYQTVLKYRTQWACRDCQVIIGGLVCPKCGKTRQKHDKEEAQQSDLMRTRTTWPQFTLWKCDSCKYKNLPERRKCFECNKGINPNPIDMRKFGIRNIDNNNNNNYNNTNEDDERKDRNNDGWQCSTCTLINPNTLNACSICSMPNAENGNNNNNGKSTSASNSRVQLNVGDGSGNGEESVGKESRMDASVVNNDNIEKDDTIDEEEVNEEHGHNTSEEASGLDEISKECKDNDNGDERIVGDNGDKMADEGNILLEARRDAYGNTSIARISVDLDQAGIGTNMRNDNSNKNSDDYVAGLTFKATPERCLNVMTTLTNDLESSKIALFRNYQRTIGRLPYGFLLYGRDKDKLSIYTGINFNDISLIMEECEQHGYLCKNMLCLISMGDDLRKAGVDLSLFQPKNVPIPPRMIRQKPKVARIRPAAASPIAPIAPIAPIESPGPDAVPAAQPAPISPVAPLAPAIARESKENNGESVPPNNSDVGNNNDNNNNNNENGERSETSAPTFNGNGAVSGTGGINTSAMNLSKCRIKNFGCNTYNGEKK